jgi:hypothetical protein
VSGRTCRVCVHDDRESIDAALLQGTPLRALGKRFGVSKDSLHRHRRDGHVAGSLKVLHGEKVEARARSLLDRIEDVVSRVERVADSAEEDGKPTLVLQAAKELRETIRLLGQATGELRDAPTTVVNVLQDPGWLELRGTLLRVLERHPEAKAEVVEALAEHRALEAG